MSELDSSGGEGLNRNLIARNKYNSWYENSLSKSVYKSKAQMDKVMHFKSTSRGGRWEEAEGRILSLNGFN